MKRVNKKRILRKNTARFDKEFCVQAENEEVTKNSKDVKFVVSWLRACNPIIGCGRRLCVPTFSEF